jgi:hypothetical protein
MINKLALKRAKVNIKSLAAEATIIRGVIKKTNDVTVKNDLHLHRLSKVRPEARLANLAIAFLKQKPRSVVEKTDKPIDIKRLHSKLSVFCWLTPVKTPSIEVIQEWLNT